MAEHLPLLVFPQKQVVAPDPGRPSMIGKPHLPEHQTQVARLSGQLDGLQQAFNDYRASIAGAVAGMDPETVLVMEIAGSVNDFKQAVDAAGLEWLGEWDIDDLEPDDDFYELDNRGNRADKPLKGRLFLSMSNEAGLKELLSLWQQWSQGRPLPHGKSKWRDVFNQLLMIRRWGIEETLHETGMIVRWHDLLDPVVADPDQKLTFQIELFYRRSPVKRRQNEQVITELLEGLGGRTLSPFIDMTEIAFHAVKAELPAQCIRQLLAEIDQPGTEIDIQLFKFSGVMYFRPTGQSLAVSDEDEGELAEFPEDQPDLPPVAAMLDGAPLLLHEALKGRLLFDDPFDVERLYQPGDRKHGTSMASLIVHGDRSNPTQPLRRKVYCIPVMQPNPDTTKRDEHIPEDVFFEDRIHLAVRRMFEGSEDVPAQAPGVKVINLSIGDLERPFIHTPSPWARLLDWLSWKYRVLFCVSAGNCGDDIDVGLSHTEFAALPDEEKLPVAIKAIAQSLSSRRLLSPAESLNALTIGASHSDGSGDYPTHLPRMDLMPDETLFSPAMRLGHGFRRSVKPEVLFPGGRQLYKTPLTNGSSVYRIDQTMGQPGQSVAWDSPTSGSLSNVVYTRGTSNATALATRSAIHVYDMLQRLREQEGEDLPEPLMTVLVKALLVHGARQPENAKEQLTAALKNARNSHQFKEVIARYIGYGAADIERVLTCTDQRATVLGCGEISENEVHEYAFPLPPGLSAQKLWRRLVITLAWFTPINPDHRNLREAKLEFEPGGTNWKGTALKVDRLEAYHYQVVRGTVQHEVREASNTIAAYQDGENLRIRVVCKKDATNRLDEVIPYGLAVTLEVKEDVNIPIYQQIRTRLRPQVAVGAGRV